MLKTIALALVLVALSSPSACSADNALPNMPIREVTVFKDGTAFVRQDGLLPTGLSGGVTIGNLQTPLLGTFWPYSSDPKARLSSVLSRRETMQRMRTADTLLDITKANIGKKATIRDSYSREYSATIFALPDAHGDDPETATGTNTSPLIVLHTVYGDQVMGFDRIQDITFPDGRNETVPKPETRNSLTLNLDWSGAKPAPQAQVGMISLQRGLSWSPSYKIVIDGKGYAAVKLQATLANELADLDNVDVNLVIGVPSFAFKDSVDPVALQATTAALTAGQAGGMARYYSNALQSQVADAREVGYTAPSQAPMPLQDPTSSKSEDLFVFGVKRVTLHKGERLVVPVAEFKIAYKDIYALDIPIAPPAETLDNLSSEQRAAIGASFAQTSVMHRLRLTNTSAYPLTTAPALILSGDRVLSQGLMKYTPIGRDGDLDLTTAVDAPVTFNEKESARIPNAESANGYTYSRVNLTGKVTVTNATDKPINLEIHRYVAGILDSATSGGSFEQSGPFAEESFLGSVGSAWTHTISWPGWWYHENSVGKATWTLTLPRGATTELGYSWHYFWR